MARNLVIDHEWLVNLTFALTSFFQSSFLTCHLLLYSSVAQNGMLFSWTYLLQTEACHLTKFTDHGRILIRDFRVQKMTIFFLMFHRVQINRSFKMLILLTFSMVPYVSCIWNCNRMKSFQHWSGGNFSPFSSDSFLWRKHRFDRARRTKFPTEYNLE